MIDLFCSDFDPDLEVVFDIPRSSYYGTSFLSLTFQFLLALLRSLSDGTSKMIPSSIVIVSLSFCLRATLAFVPVPVPKRGIATCNVVIPDDLLDDSYDHASVIDPDLFQDEEEMWNVAEHFVHAKYQQCARDHGHEQGNAQDVTELLRSLLPPVTPDELDQEVQSTLKIILENPENTPENIQEDCFVKAVVKNSYWRSAGSLVVKELMYFDALHAYYQTGQSLLNDDDYQELKENLTWEGSSVASMNKKEAMFVNAVASSKRGEPYLNDKEYSSLKNDLKKQKSWVTARGQDALEKMGLDTFMGYLHRALK